MRIHKNEAKAYVPGHITGIFRIFDECEDSLKCGSMGAGFSIRAGTITKVLIQDSARTEIEVTYNNRVIDAPVTGTVVHEMLTDNNMQAHVTVSHISDLPVGAGFGASGAGSLGTALALGALLDDDMTIETAGQYAHRAEVLNHTGLGDVIAQTVGGIEIRTRPGAPGVGEVIQLKLPDSLHLVIAGRSGIETRDVLTDSTARQSINTTGDQLIARVISDPTFENVIECSKDFAKAIGLMTPRVSGALQHLWAAGFSKSSMVMLGDSIFAFCEESDIAHVHNILSKHWDDSEIMVTTITEHGGGLI